MVRRAEAGPEPSAEPSAKPASGGFTLIEVMVVLLLVSLLAVAAVPFTADWIDSADVRQASGQLEQAIRMAKARALRNAAEALGNDPAARLRHEAGANELRVCQALSGACTATWWQASLPSGVTLSPEGLEVLFNNRGQSSAGAVSYTLAKGDEQALGQIH